MALGRAAPESILLWICVASLAWGNSPNRYIEQAQADTDNSGRIHIVLSDGSRIRMPLEKDQVDTQQLQIAPDGIMAGWLVRVPNCCTSYPIPTTLILYAPGRPIRRLGDGLMIYTREFLGKGDRVAINSGTVHGMTTVNLTLWDVRNGKLLQKWNGAWNDLPPTWGAGVARFGH